MTQKEYKRLFDKHRIVTISSGTAKTRRNDTSLPIFSEYILLFNSREFDNYVKFFGNSCDRYVRNIIFTFN